MSTFSTNGMFVGICVDNQDPLKIGRIKVRVPIIYGTIPTEDLPWADPSFPYTYHDQGFFFIPEVGAFVTVWFLNGSKIRPIWTGGIHRPNENIPPQVAMENYTYRKVVKTKVGYVLFDDKTNFIQIKHKNGSEIIFDDTGDIIIHAARDINMISDRHIHLNSYKHGVIPLPEYKSQVQLDTMPESEVKKYNQGIAAFNDKVTTNCNTGGSEAHSALPKGSTAKPPVGGHGSLKQSDSPMRMWGAQNRLNLSDAERAARGKDLGKLKHGHKGNGCDLTFNKEFGGRIDNSLDDLKANHPDLYDKFMFTDGYRQPDVGYGSSRSLHKSGMAFDFNAKSFTFEEREQVYKVFARNGVVCPLDVWNGQDEHMHMEMSKTFYTGD